MDLLEQQVRIELKKGGSKKNIFKKLATANNKDDLVWYLDQYPTAQKRQKILWIYSSFSKVKTPAFRRVAFS